ncbi:hypothetical protein HC928_18260 [bacterium]|nr:hypothetical protein [bacterium]
MWNKILDKFDSRYTGSLADQCAQKARQNILTSTNWNGSKMITRKKQGKPLIDTGYMLSAITNVGNKTISPADYSVDVQIKTGNIFLQRPTTKDIATWTKLYILKHK